MSRFFVGQPVRVNCPVSSSHGEECRVTALEAPGFDAGKHFLGVEVDILCNREFPYCVFECHELEPIIPDGNSACDDEFKRDLDKMLEGLPA